jgi:hypothetical protein
MALATPQAVIQRAAITHLPEYEDTGEMKDCAGFYTFRCYPTTTPLAGILTADGRPAVRCYLAFIVDAPEPGSHVSSVLLKAWFALRWRFLREFGSAPAPGDPDVPSPQSAVLLQRARIPVRLDPEDAEGFIYDSREDAFLDPDGRVVTPVEMLHYMYQKHCRTLRIGFRVRWAVGSIARRTIRQVVWKGQDAAMWALLNFYDMELVPRKKGMMFDFFHKYRPSDFRRATDKQGERSQFFGFQSSQRSFYTNLIVVAAACLLVYWKVPHDGLLRAIYNNTALTTATLLLGFLLADTVGPWLLIGTVCTLSRFRDAVLFFIRKVRV